MVNVTSRRREHGNNEGEGLVLSFASAIFHIQIVQLFRRRINATKDYSADPLLKALVTSFWLYCTPEVMSEDETDSEYDGPADRVGHFIKIMNWRNPDVVNFFRVLDALYFSTRFKGNKWSPGRFPHTRIPSVRLTECDAVPGLPVNFYRPQWLLQLNDMERRKLKTRPAIDLDFSQEILRCVNAISLMQPLTATSEFLHVFCISGIENNSQYLVTILHYKSSLGLPFHLVFLWKTF